MQTVSAAFTAEEKDTVRNIVANLQVAWHKETNLSGRTFTIGVSTIGGNDIIGITPGAVGSPGIYRYFDESAYLMSLGWEHGLNMPTGGLVRRMAEAKLDNTSGRFLPRYMGGRSELFTAILPRRPVKISAGFNFGGVDQMVPQFAGIITDQPQIDLRAKVMSLKMADYTSFFGNKYLDKVAMFTGQRTDQILQTLFTRLGMNTAQYDLDYGINIVPFAIFDVNAKFSEIIQQLVEAENGHLYQDEQGIFKFENRQHWSSAPYNAVQKLITTAMVLNAEAPSTDHLVNVVEVKSAVRTKQPSQPIFTLSTPLQLAPSTDTPFFVQFDDPILAMDTPTTYIANSNEDGSGTDRTASVQVKSVDLFAQSAKIVFTNISTSAVFLTTLTLAGRPARVTTNIDYQIKDSSSVTAYEESPVSIDNDFIQSDSWAQTYAQMILNDFSSPENLQRITVRAMPELQLGDLISWQGRYWRIYDNKSTLDPSVGFTQELLLLQKTIVTYFRIGISTIGGSDAISP